MLIFTPEHFTSLLCQARSGSSEALGKLLEPCRMHLLTGARRQLPGELLKRVDLAGLVQDTFQAAVVAFREFQGTTENELLNWLRAIMKNRAVNMGRDLQTKRRGAGLPVSLEERMREGTLGDYIPDDDATPYTSTSKRERREIMYRALDQLKPSHRQVIELHHLGGKSIAVIAAELGKTPESVLKTWKRALLAWREAMEGLGIEDS